MALGVLEIIFMTMMIVSGIGIICLYMTKNQKIKTGLLYFLAIWGIGIAYMNVTRFPSNELGSQLLAGVFGLLSLVAIGIKMIKADKTSLAQLFVVAGLLLSIIHLLMF